MSRIIFGSIKIVPAVEVLGKAMSFVLLGLEPATYYNPQVATLVQLPRSNSVSASFPSSFSGVGFTLASGMLFRSIALAVTHVFPLAHAAVHSHGPAPRGATHHIPQELRTPDSARSSSMRREEICKREIPTCIFGGT